MLRLFLKFQSILCKRGIVVWGIDSYIFEVAEFKSGIIFQIQATGSRLVEYLSKFD